jgi:hypothetical protein
MIEKNVLVFLIFIGILIILFLNNEQEHYVNYADPAITQFAQNAKNPKSVQLAQIGTREGPDPYEGLLFSDVVFYEGAHTVDGDLGLERCIKNCKGMCVEYGQTGDAYCFPYEYADISQYPTKSVLAKNAIRPDSNEKRNSYDINDEKDIVTTYRFFGNAHHNKNYPVKTQLSKITFRPGGTA